LLLGAAVPGLPAHEPRSLFHLTCSERQVFEINNRPPAPVCFGFLSPAWLPRRLYAGTYDAKWQKERFPLLPLDFDPTFYRASAPEQTIAGYLQGGEPVAIRNACPVGDLAFSVPRRPLEITATPSQSTPSISAGSFGVALVVTRKTVGGVVQVNGAFQVPVAEAKTTGRPLHRALVCAVWSAGGYQDSLAPLRDVMLIPDDKIQNGDKLWGAFRFEIDLYPGDGFYLHVALGPYLSSSVCCPR
jgi:hypothetical protein